MMNWNRDAHNQPAILASAVITGNRFFSRVKPAFAAIGSNAADPMRRVFAGKIFAHKQPVTSFTAKQRLTVFLRNQPRLAFKIVFALLADKRERAYPSRIFAAPHAVRGEGVCRSFSCAKRVTKFVVVWGGIFSKDRFCLTASRTKARFVGTVNRPLIFAPTFRASIRNAISFSKSATGTTAKFCIRGFGGDSMKTCVALLADNLNFHGRIISQFMGSGTTLRAAKDLGLKGIGIELEEKYCEIAANRLRQQAFNFQEAA